MNCNYTLSELRSKYRTDFVDYFSYLGLSSTLEDDSNILSALSPTSQYESVKTLQLSLQSSLRNRKDHKELMGLAATQVGIPVHAVYFEYINSSNSLTDILLLDPQIEPKKMPKGSSPELFLKLVKCPSSPSPYHIGLFNKNIIIKSSNHKPFSLSAGVEGDLNGTISANLQKIIWADKGYIPGDTGNLPMNYFKVAETLEESVKLQEAFNCYIHNSEIHLIASKFNLVDSMGYHRIGAKNLRNNLIQLLTNNIDKEWIKIPSQNLYKKLDNKFLVS